VKPTKLELCNSLFSACGAMRRGLVRRKYARYGGDLEQVGDFIALRGDLSDKLIGAPYTARSNRHERADAFRRSRKSCA
jgi:hypothetical protein